MDLEHLYAYPEEQRGLEAVMRFHAVKRWHMIDTTRVQNLAEHSANVALLGYLIAVTAPQAYFGTATAVATMGLLHDLSEVFIGDIPTPTKRVVNSFDLLEHRVLPSEFSFAVDADVRNLIKLCDLADGIRFIRIHGVDVTAQHARVGLDVQMKQLLTAMLDEWPLEVQQHVARNTTFYAYEYS
jgi:hypothetical protein